MGIAQSLSLKPQSRQQIIKAKAEAFQSEPVLLAEAHSNTDGIRQILNSQKLLQIHKNIIKPKPSA